MASTMSKASLTDHIDEGTVRTPFEHNARQHEGSLQFLKMVFVGCTLFPIRLVVLLLSFFTMWLAAFVGMKLTAHINRGKPQELSVPTTKHQRICRRVMQVSARLILWSFGYWWIQTKGKHDPEAPILTANHVSFADPFYFSAVMLPMAVSKEEVLKMPVVGTFGHSQQCISVSRDSANSRQQVADEICRRTQWRKSQSAETIREHGHWPPLLIFPEATCTNTSSIIEFKQGAFAPLMPVQPVALDFRQKHLDVSWVGNSCLPLTILRMMCQVYNRLEVTYLPTIQPPQHQVDIGDASPINDTKKATIQEFANQTQMAIATALTAPITKHNFLDDFLDREAQKLGLPPHVIDVQLESHREGYSHARGKLREFVTLNEDKTGFLSSSDFAEFLGFGRHIFASSGADNRDDDGSNATYRAITAAVLSLWDTDGDGRLDFHNFLAIHRDASNRLNNSNHSSLSFSMKKQKVERTTSEEKAQKKAETEENQKKTLTVQLAALDVFDAFAVDTTNRGRIIPSRRFRTKLPQLAPCLFSSAPPSPLKTVNIADALFALATCDNQQHPGFVTPKDLLSSTLCSEHGNLLLAVVTHCTRMLPKSPTTPISLSSVADFRAASSSSSSSSSSSLLRPLCFNRRLQRENRKKRQKRGGIASTMSSISDDQQLSSQFISSESNSSGATTDCDETN